MFRTAAHSLLMSVLLVLAGGATGFGDEYYADYYADGSSSEAACCECSECGDCCCDAHGHGHDDYSHWLKHDRVDSHAPAGLMGEHMHEQGEWMVEYKFAQMHMDGNRTGSRRISDVEALAARPTARASTLL